VYTGLEHTLPGVNEARKINLVNRIVVVVRVHHVDASEVQCSGFQSGVKGSKQQHTEYVGCGYDSHCGVLLLRRYLRWFTVRRYGNHTSATGPKGWFARNKQQVCKVGNR
jgi:hypothetical protein